MKVELSERWGMLEVEFKDVRIIIRKDGSVLMYGSKNIELVPEKGAKIVIAHSRYVTIEEV